jgi:hypothetical protein
VDLFKKELEKQMQPETGKPNFGGYYFPENWDFSGHKFEIDGDFSFATFQGDANFSGTTFQNASFIGATFQDARFYKATFQDARFREATFQNADFISATFQNAYFRNTIFCGNANFKWATFQNAYFSEPLSRIYLLLGVSYERYVTTDKNSYIYGQLLGIKKEDLAPNIKKVKEIFRLPEGQASELSYTL